MKRFSKLLLSFVALCATVMMQPSLGNATPIYFSTTYTADNYVTDLTLSGGGQTIDLGSKLNGWQQSSTVSTYNGAPITLQAGTAYTATWKVINVSLSDPDQSYNGVKPSSATMSSGNPMAFLGTITVGGTTYASAANAMWQVDNGQNKGLTYQLGAASGANIWTSNKLQNSGIYGTAAWIGSTSSGDDPTGQFTVTAKFTTTPSKTPIPGAIWLLGSGVAGLIGFKRKKFMA